MALADPTDRDDAQADQHASLRLITQHVQLLQRQLLRADGLTTLERDLMLGTLVAVRGGLDDLTRRLGGQTHVWNQPSGGNVSARRQD